MEFNELTLIAFTVSNSLRVLACFPQILSAAKDLNGCSSVSCTTWALLLVANVSAVGYALTNVNDVTMAVIFAARHRLDQEAETPRECGSQRRNFAICKRASATFDRPALAHRATQITQG